MQATIPAVSVLNLDLPNDTGLKPASIASFISLVEKSPSGPIKIKVSCSNEKSLSSFLF